MASKFAGTWQDPNGFHATIQGDGETVKVQYTDVNRGPFDGQEQDPKIAPAFVKVNFSDFEQVIQGTLQNAGQEIHWSNNTVWKKVNA